MKNCTKSEIAVSSLNSAYRRFLEKDYVASNILAGAGRQILQDLCVDRGIEPVITTLSANLGHSCKDIQDLLVASYNQMKHADRDPNDHIEVSEERPRALMSAAANDLMRLNEEPTKETREFLESVENLKNELI
jgi:hypothetical protein